MKISWISVWPPRISPIALYSESIVSKLRQTNLVNVVSHVDAGRSNEPHLSSIIDLENLNWPEKVFQSIKKNQPDLVCIQHSFSSFGYDFETSEFSNAPEDSFSIINLLYRLKAEKIPVLIFYHDLALPLTDSEILFYKLSSQLSSAAVVFNLYNKNLFSNRFSNKVFSVMPLTNQYHSFSKQGLRQKWNISESAFVLSLTGYFEPYKNFEQMIAIFNKLSKEVDKEIILLVAGTAIPGIDESIKYEKKILKIIEKKQNIRLINRYLENHEINELIQLTDLLVLPYSKCSQSLLQMSAISFGTPMLSSNLATLKEYSLKSKSGGFINFSNIEQAVRYLKGIISKPDILQRWSYNALKFHQKNNFSSVIKQYSEIFRKTITRY